MRVLVFGGTTEGRGLSSALSNAGIDVTLSVATEFGRSAAEMCGAVIMSERLGAEDIVSLLRQGAFDCVIDATHPYAAIATKNISSACNCAGIKYLRLKRPESKPVSGITYVTDAHSAVEILNKNNEKALLTIGSKELVPFTFADNFAKRFYIRILPMEESLKKALELGFHGSNIICMQGPFDKEMNAATLKMTGAKYLVTKDSGGLGGFEAKVSAALSLGCEVIVIKRPVQEDGYTYDDILKLFNINELKKDADDAAVKVFAKESHRADTAKNAFFPLFIDMRGRKALVIGGGRVAERRVKALVSFGAIVTVISPRVTQYIEGAASQGAISLVSRKYIKGDIAGLEPFLVLAATDERQANYSAMAEASCRNIHVSVADSREECTFFFPAIAESDAYIAGLVSKNGDHAGVKKTAERIRGLLNT